MRETVKTITVLNREFVIKKFDALTGSYIISKLVGLLAPAFISATMGKEELNLTESLTGILMKLKRDDFAEIQRDCLNAVSEKMPAGLQPILNQNGTWGVMGIEDDTMMVMSLTIQSLLFNVKGFFGESDLTAETVKTRLALYLPSLKM